MIMRGGSVLVTDMTDHKIFRTGPVREPYPRITVRLVFRDSNIIGTFVYHCHILQHKIPA
jgi:hypothetical protein